MNTLRIATLATTCWIGGLTGLVTAPQAVAEEAAAPFQIANEGLPKHWLQGDPVKEMKKDHLYVFEFWATWCGPCIAQMPHIEELYRATKDNDSVSIIGVNVFDNTPVEKLKKFVEKKGVTYPMAADGSRKGPAAQMWLEPLGVTGIPHTIAVRNHEVLWRGHPAKLSEALIKRLSDPNFKPKEMAAADVKKQEEERKATAKVRSQVSEIYSCDPDKAAELADQFIADGVRGAKDLTSYRTAAFTKLFHSDRHTEAQEQLAKLAEEAPDDFVTQIRLATIIITTDELENKDLDLAIRSLERNIELNPDTRSIAYQRITDAKLMKGDREGAIEAAKLAVKYSPHQQDLDAHLKSLKEANQ